MSQLALLADRKFWPLFGTQFLGALNDNLFKTTVVMLITFSGFATISQEQGKSLILLSTGIFILPFFLFSSTAGQVSDKYSKTRLMRWVKAVEIVIMLVAAVGFWLNNLTILLVVLFCMGTQSAFFGPAKYSVLPELVSEGELVGGNALVEAGTFLAILLGTIGGGLLAAGKEPLMLGTVVIVLAVLGWFVSMALPKTVPAVPDLHVDRNPVTPMIATFRITRQNRSVFLSVMAISWFWALGSIILTVLPLFGRDVLHGNEHVVTFLLATFAIGISIGSLLCERLSGETIELGLVPLGSIGLSLFSLDLMFVGMPYVSDHPLGVMEMLQQPGAWRICLDFVLLAVSGGIYTVPLYAMIQSRSSSDSRSRVIAGNNILNACFMVVASIGLVGMSALDLTIPQIFGVVSAVNVVVALYIYSVIPEFFLRFCTWILAKMTYRIGAQGVANIPRDGPVILVCNHVTYVDWLLIAAVCRRPPRFAMYHLFFKIPLLGKLFRDAKVIPIAPRNEDEAMLAQAYDKIAEELEAGEVVCVFPEGELTTTGEMVPFKRGIEKMLRRSPAPVVPMALKGLWGSYFCKGKTRGPFGALRAKIELVIGEPIPAEQVTAALLQERVAELLDS